MSQVDGQFNTLVYRGQDGNLYVKSLGSVNVRSGGVINIEAGGALQFAGVDAAAALALGVAGVAAGYKIARGTMTPVSASDTVVTGLATVVAAFAVFQAAPTVDQMWVIADKGNQTGAPAAGSILIKTFKPTATGNVTPTAATANWILVDWFAIGT